ncbi:MAG: hypothetical protein ACRC6I_00730, partial [Paracoccaceae bacterium]
GIIAINHVQVEGHPGVFSYLPNLYLTSLPAQLSGVALYGMNKRMGQLAMDDSSYRVASTTGTPIWSARYQQQGFARPLAASPECARVQSLTEQTLVMVGKFSPWQFAAFDFNLSSAHVAGVSAEITITDPALADLPAGQMTARALSHDGAPPPDSTGLPGAFRIWTSWTLSNPLDSARIARLEAENVALP